MQFSFSHDFDIPLDALELAALSPELASRIGERLRFIEAVHQKSHKLTGERLERVLVYQASMNPPAFAHGVLTKEMCAWDEHTIYDLRRHRSEWNIEPHVKPEWRKYFRASGTYELQPLGEDRTRRVEEGAVVLDVPRVVRAVAERLVVAEVRKAYDAEAAALRELATLA